MAAKSTPLPTWANFALGGLAGCIATTSTHPIDLVVRHFPVLSSTAARLRFSATSGVPLSSQKTRMQLAGEATKDGVITKKLNSWQTLVGVVKNEGIAGCYKG